MQLISDLCHAIPGIFDLVLSYSTARDVTSLSSVSTEFRAHAFGNSCRYWSDHLFPRYAALFFNDASPFWINHDFNSDTMSLTKRIEMLRFLKQRINCAVPRSRKIREASFLLDDGPLMIACAQDEEVVGVAGRIDKRIFVVRGKTSSLEELEEETRLVNNVCSAIARNPRASLGGVFLGDIPPISQTGADYESTIIFLPRALRDLTAEVAMRAGYHICFIHRHGVITDGSELARLRKLIPWRAMRLACTHTFARLINFSGYLRQDSFKEAAIQARLFALAELSSFDLSHSFLLCHVAQGGVASTTAFVLPYL